MLINSFLSVHKLTFQVPVERNHYVSLSAIVGLCFRLANISKHLQCSLK